MPAPIESLEQFYAHALAIEREAAERYVEFENWFHDRDEEVLAGMCRELARHELEHFQRLATLAQGLDLPPIPADRYHWIDEGAPEAPAHELFYRVATPRQLLEVALAGERHARAFFEWVARTAGNERVRRAAVELAEEEREHARWVRQAMQYREPHADWEKLLARGIGPGAIAP